MAQKEREINGVIYMIVNCINGKKYIGRDSRDNPKYLGGGLYLEKAQKKYGRNNFIKITIRRCYTMSDLIKQEQYYLDLYDVAHNKRMYNKCANSVSGGKNGKKVYQYSLDGIYIAMFCNIKTAADSLGFHLEAVRSAVLRNGSCGGFLWSFEKTDKLRAPDNPNLHRYYLPKEIHAYTLDGLFFKTFKSLGEAARFTGVNLSNIRGFINGEQQRAGNYIWLGNKKDSLNQEELESFIGSAKTTLFYYKPNGDYMGYFNLIKDAVNHFHTHSSALTRVLDKPGRLHRGYLWSRVKFDKYPSDYIKEGADRRNAKYKLISRPIVRVNSDGVEIARYESVMMASRDTGIPHTTIHGHCKKRKEGNLNYTWMFLEDAA